MNSSQRRIFGALAAVAVVLGAWALWSRGWRPSTEVGRANEIVIAVEATPLTTDPIAMVETASAALGQALHSPLWRVRGDGTLDYILAESLTMAEDGLSATIKLRQDAGFADGSPITAVDVASSLQRFKDSPNPLATVMERIFKIEATDNLTVVVNLREPDSEFVKAVGHLSASIVSQRSVGQPQQPLDRQIVGAGPWVLDSFEAGVRYELRRNNRFPHPQSCERIVFVVRTDGQAALRDFRAGKIQIIRLRGPQLGEVSDFATGATVLRPEYQKASLKTAPASQLDTLIVNWAAPAFSGITPAEKRGFLSFVRSALDAGTIVRSGETRETGTFPPTVTLSGKIEAENNPVWKPSREIELLAPTETASRNLAGSVRDAISAQGAPVVLRTLDVAQLIPTILKRDFTVALVGFEMPVPGIVAWRLFWTPGPFSAFGEPLTDYPLYEARCRAGAPNERAAALVELLRWHAQTQSVWIPVVSRPTTLLCAPGAEGFPIDGAGSPIWDFSRQ